MWPDTSGACPLALGDAQQHDARFFAQIVAGRAHQVPDVLDEQQVDRIRLPLGRRVGDHAGVQVAGAAGGDLAHREAVARQALRAVVRLYVAGRHGHAPPWFEGCQRALQQHGLAGTRLADQVHAPGSMPQEALAQIGRQAVVFVQNFALTGHAGHVSSISIQVNSSSWPLAISVSAEPHWGHSVRYFWAAKSCARWRRLRQGRRSISSESGARSVSCTRASKQKRSDSESTPESSPILTPNASTCALCRVDSARTASSIEPAMLISCMMAGASPMIARVRGL